MGMNTSETCYRSYDISGGFSEDGYDIPFDYTDSDISVFLARSYSGTAKDSLKLVNGKDYTVVSTTKRLYMQPVGEVSGYAELVIYRTSTFTQLVQLQSGTPVNPVVIERMVDKLCSIAQELKRDFNFTLRIPFGDGGKGTRLPSAQLRANRFFSFDANGDVSLVDMSTTLQPYVTASQRNADIAQLAASESAQSASDAKTYAQNATDQATLAEASKESAYDYKISAETAEANAKTSATNAAASSSASASSATEAKTSEVNAKTSETNAKSSELNAKTSETRAVESARKASDSEANAKTSETRASEYAESASASATSASASATNASASETSAKLSATNAKTSETDAATSATNAANSATTATEQATIATTKASEAAASAAEAKAMSQYLYVDSDGELSIND